MKVAESTQVESEEEPTQAMVDSNSSAPLNPKRPTNPKLGAGSVPSYDYYAGYSPAFVESMIVRLGLGSNAVLLDPWNGAGTTTEVASRLGVDSIGIDINPAMEVVARSRLSESIDSQTWRSTLEGIIEKAKSGYTESRGDEPLNRWFIPRSSGMIRSIVETIKADVSLRGSPSEARLLVAAFRAARQLAASFQTTNPTWIRRRVALKNRLRPSVAQIASVFSAAAIESPSNSNARTGDREGVTRFEVAKSTELPIDDETIDAIISSPPYCTRIDYIVATQIELATLGVTDCEAVKLRGETIGTTLTTKTSRRSETRWGDECVSLMDRIEKHKAKASKTYYWLSLFQYFDGIYKSMEEIARVLKQSGVCVLVVQDSYYKDVRIDLQKIFEQFGQSMGLERLERWDYRVAHNLATIHSSANKYRLHSEAVESVLVFRKAQGRK